ncbi:hypothetical protein [Streptomyces sp. NPDC096323]|uniref:hypothetical protein n=1 Tax=Streptomyces sp. NPDC096323 TaxID=3155822 RepID=UPI003322471B
MPASSRGSDGGKKITGRKRHIVSARQGCADGHGHRGERDRPGSIQILLARLAARFFLLRLVWADGGYTGRWSTSPRRCCV